MNSYAFVCLFVSACLFIEQIYLGFIESLHYLEVKERLYIDLAYYSLLWAKPTSKQNNIKQVLVFILYSSCLEY